MLIYCSLRQGEAFPSPGAALGLLAWIAFLSWPAETQDYCLYRANLHSHTRMSDGLIFPNPAAEYEYASLLGWNLVSVTDHGEDLNIGQWKLSGRQEVFSGSFAGLRGLEWSSDDTGHSCVLGSQDWVGAHGNGGLSPDKVKASLADFYSWVADNPSARDTEERIVCQFNHPTSVHKGYPPCLGTQLLFPQSLGGAGLLR